MYPGVPTGKPVRVRFAPPAVLIALAMPKSDTIGWPCEKRMFSGLMSRCSTPMRCAYESASATGAAIASAWSAPRGRLPASCWRSEPPSMYGMT